MGSNVKNFILRTKARLCSNGLNVLAEVVDKAICGVGTCFADMALAKAVN